MSRSGYSDDCDGWDLIRWRGAVNSAVKGKRGQAFVREAIAALDAMPDKALITDELVSPEGQFCTLGCVGAARGLDLKAINYDDPSAVGAAFGVARALAAEVMFMNDENACDDYEFVEFQGPRQPNDFYPRDYIRVHNPRATQARWGRMRAWLESLLEPDATP